MEPTMPNAFQQARDIKSQSIEGLKQLCSSFADARKLIDGYNQNKMPTQEASFKKEG